MRTAAALLALTTALPWPALAVAPAFALQQGTMLCHDAQQLELHADGTHDISLRWHHRVYQLQQRDSAAGAWHYADPADGLMLVQIPAKTMLFDTRRMTRLADDCMTPSQLATR